MINSIYILFALREIKDAKELLKYLADNMNGSIIPESFDKDKSEFIYDSIDNFFWYLLSVLKFVEITGEWKFIKDFLWEKIRTVLHDYSNNHIPGVKVDFDGLLLLDLDAGKKINKGKIIEYPGGKHIALNCLWYNAMRIMELFSAKFADIEYHARTQELSFIIKKNFHNKFWNKEGDYFSNRIDVPPDKKIDNSLRPYQIFTISFPYSDLIHYKTKRKIFDLIHDKLLTPYGLLTLSPDSNNYTPNFNPEKPDTAYNGIIHPYLFFHYITAFLKLNKYSKQAKKETKSLLSKFEKKIKTNNIGFFPQFVDSQPSYNSAGSLDYSMTLSEYLRVRIEELGSI